MSSGGRREHVFFLICTVACMVIVWPLIVPIAAGAAIGYVCEGTLETLLAKTRRLRAALTPIAILRNRGSSEPLWRWLMALVLMVGILGVFLVPMILFVFSTIQQTAALFDPASNPLLQPGTLNRGIEWISAKLAEFGITASIAEIVTQGKVALGRVSSMAASTLQSAVSGTPEKLVDLTLFLMAWAVFLVNGRSLRAFFLPKVIPWKREREILCETTGDVLRAVIVANILVSLVQAIVVFSFLLPTGTPNVLLWSGLAFFLSFIPLVGTAPIMVGAAVYAFMNDRPGAGIALVVGTVLVGGVDNVLRPFFVKGRASLDFFWVFVAFIGGIAQFGVAGTVLGPLAFSLFVAASKALRGDEISSS
jgi:predicted PurR-regulated permease PerM